MTLAEKLKDLRLQDGKSRGMNRALTQSEVARLIKTETGRSLTQAYLSQLESGKRRHLTADTREQLARFFKVHPGYLVDDLPASRRRTSATSLGKWLQEGHEMLKRDDPPTAALLQELAADRNPRRYFDLLGAILRRKDAVKLLFKEYHIQG